MHTEEKLNRGLKMALYHTRSFHVTVSEMKIEHVLFCSKILHNRKNKIKHLWIPALQLVQNVKNIKPMLIKRLNDVVPIFCTYSELGADQITAITLNIETP